MMVEGRQEYDAGRMEGLKDSKKEGRKEDHGRKDERKEMAEGRKECRL